MVGYVTLVRLETVQGDLKNATCNLFKKAKSKVPHFSTYDNNLCSDSSALQGMLNK